MSGEPHAGRPRVELFTTGPGCGLCERAWDQLLTLAGPLGFSPRKVLIEKDTQVPSDYLVRVPVVHVDGRPVIEGRIRAADLERALRAAGIRPRADST